MYLKELTTVLILGAALANGAAVSLAADVTRARELFDFDWKFSSGEVEGAEKVTFDSSKWQAVDLPHDFSIIGPFDKDAPLGTRYGFRPLGIGWYRKTFPTPAATCLLYTSPSPRDS